MSRLDLSKLNPEQVKALRNLDNVTEDFCNKLEETLTHLRTLNTQLHSSWLSEVMNVEADHSKSIIKAKQLLNQK